MQTRRFASLLLLLTTSAWCQSQVHLSTQSKGMDFTGFPSTKPMRTGTTLPGSCSTGEMYFKTDAPSGQGLYACVAGSWSVVGSGGVDVPFHTILDLQPSISATVLTIAAGRCWGGQKATMTATITGGTGNGSFVVYCNESQAVVVEHSTSAGLTVSCANCVPAQLAMPSIPEGLYPIATGTISSGQWSAVTDLRDFSVRARHTNGIGMNVQCSGGTCVHQVDSAIVQTKADPYTPLGTFDASSATITKPVRTGTSVPGTCTVGDQFFKTDAAAGQNLYGCTASNVWTVLGAPAVAVHTEWLPTGSCANSDTPAPEMGRWWEPKNGLSAAASSCSASATGPAKTMSRVFRGSAADIMLLAIPLAQNRTGNIDLSLHGFDTAGTGTFKLTIDKACMTTGLASDLSYSFSDAQSLQWTSTATTTATRTLSAVTVPSGCTGHGLLLRLMRDVAVSGNSSGDYHMQGATLVQRTN